MSAYTTDFAAMGLSAPSPWDILQPIKQAPITAATIPQTASEKKQKQRERNRIFMAGVRLKEKALRVNAHADLANARQYREAQVKNDAIHGVFHSLGR